MKWLVLIETSAWRRLEPQRRAQITAKAAEVVQGARWVYVIGDKTTRDECRLYRVYPVW